MTNRSTLDAFDPDASDDLVNAYHLDVRDYAAENPVHQHRKGQLILALHGATTLQAEGGLWMVPPQCGVWIPGGVPHSNRMTPNARLCFAYVEPGVAAMPDRCCTLAISPMVRAIIDQLASTRHAHGPPGHLQRIMQVLLDELTLATCVPMHELHLPISSHPKLQDIARALQNDPADRRTLTQWARHLAMSERSLARLMVRETGLTFGRWRQQLHLIVALRALAGDASVQRVSSDLGYESVTAFITMFKKALGMPPARYFAQRNEA